MINSEYQRFRPMRKYNNSRRSIIILALRYAITHLAASIEGDVWSDEELEKMETQLADMEAMHRNLTGHEFRA